MAQDIAILSLMAQLQKGSVKSVTKQVADTIRAAEQEAGQIDVQIDLDALEKSVQGVKQLLSKSKFKDLDLGSFFKDAALSWDNGTKSAESFLAIMERITEVLNALDDSSVFKGKLLQQLNYLKTGELEKVLELYDRILEKRKKAESAAQKAWADADALNLKSVKAEGTDTLQRRYHSTDSYRQYASKEGVHELAVQLGLAENANEELDKSVYGVLKKYGQCVAIVEELEKKQKELAASAPSLENLQQSVQVSQNLAAVKSQMKQVEDGILAGMEQVDPAKLLSSSLKIDLSPKNTDVTSMVRQYVKAVAGAARSEIDPLITELINYVTAKAAKGLDKSQKELDAKREQNEKLRAKAQETQEKQAAQSQAAEPALSPEREDAARQSLPGVSDAEVGRVRKYLVSIEECYEAIGKLNAEMGEFDFEDLTDAQEDRVFEIMSEISSYYERLRALGVKDAEINEALERRDAYGTYYDYEGESASNPTEDIAYFKKMQGDQEEALQKRLASIRKVTEAQQELNRETQQEDLSGQAAGAEKAAQAAEHLASANKEAAEAARQAADASGESAENAQEAAAAQNRQEDAGPVQQSLDAVTQDIDLINQKLADAQKIAVNFFQQMADQADRFDRILERVNLKLDDMRYFMGNTDIAYHQGNLDNLSQTRKSESWTDRVDGLANGEYGAWGTGTYITKNLSEFHRGSKSKVYAVDLSKYNLYVNQTEEQARQLNEYLKSLEKFVLASGDFRGFDQDIQGLTEDKLFADASEAIRGFNLTKQEFYDFIEQMKQLVQESHIDAAGEYHLSNADLEGSDSIPTRLMKKLGWEGINNSYLPDYDNVEHGSVIYDLNSLDPYVKKFTDFNELIEYNRNMVQQTSQAWTAAFSGMEQFSRQELDTLEQVKQSAAELLTTLRDIRNLPADQNQTMQPADETRQLMEAKERAAQAEQAVKQAQGTDLPQQEAVSAQIQNFNALNALLDQIAADLATLRTAFGQIDDESGAADLLTQINRINASLQTTADIIQQIVPAISGINNAMDSVPQIAVTVADHAEFTKAAEQARQLAAADAQAAQAAQEMEQAQQAAQTADQSVAAQTQAFDRLSETLSKVSRDIELIRTAFGQIDDESGIGTLLSQLAQLNATLKETAELLANMPTPQPGGADSPEGSGKDDTKYYSGNEVTELRESLKRQLQRQEDAFGLGKLDTVSKISSDGSATVKFIKEIGKEAETTTFRVTDVAEAIEQLEKKEFQLPDFRMTTAGVNKNDRSGLYSEKEMEDYFSGSEKMLERLKQEFDWGEISSKGLNIKDSGKASVEFIKEMGDTARVTKVEILDLGKAVETFNNAAESGDLSQWRQANLNVSTTARTIQPKAVKQPAVEQQPELSQEEQDIQDLIRAYNLLSDTEMKFSKLQSQIEQRTRNAGTINQFNQLRQQREEAQSLIAALSKQVTVTDEVTAAQKRYNQAQTDTRAAERQAKENAIGMEANKTVAQLNKETDTLSKMPGMFHGWTDSVEHLKSEISALQSDLAKLDSTNEKSVRTYKEEAKSIHEHAAALKEDQDAYRVMDNNQAAQLYTDFDQWIRQNHKAVIAFRDDVDQIQGVRLTNLSDADYKKTASMFDELRAKAERTGQVGNTMIDQWLGRLKNLGMYISSFVSFYQLVNVFKQGIEVVKEYDTAMTNLYKVSSDTRQELDRFGQASYDIASGLGATNTAVIDAATEWERLGYNIAQAQELAQASVIYSNVGEIDATTASSDLVSILKAFDIESSNVMKVVDSLNEIGNNYAVSSAELGEALKKSSASLAVSGDSVDEVIAMAAAMNEVTQDASVTGNTLKMLSLRLRGTKTEIEAAGESTEGMAESTSKLRAQIAALTNVDGKGGFDILKSNDEYKTTYDILKGIADVWDDMSQINQAALLELIAGKNRAQGAAALIENFSTAEAALKDSIEAEGSAERENAAYMESIEGHINVLQNKYNQLWQGAINRDAINFWIDLGSSILDVANDIGLVRTALSAVGVALGTAAAVQGRGLFQTQFDTKSGLATGIARTMPKRAELAPKTGIFADLDRSQIDWNVLNQYNQTMLQLDGSTAEAAKACKKFIDAQSGLSNATKEVLTQLNGQLAPQQTIDANLQSMAVKTQAASLGWQALGMAMNVAASALVVAGINAIIGVLDALIVTTEEADQAWQEANTKYEETQTTLDGLNAELETNRERYQELVDIQSRRPLTYAEQAELDKLSEANSQLKMQIGLLERRAEIEARNAAQEAVNDFHTYGYSFDEEKLNQARAQGQETGLWGKTALDAPLEGEIAFYEHLIQQRTELNERLAQLGKDANETERRQLEAQIEENDRLIASHYADLQDATVQWHGWLDSISLVPESNRTSEQKTIYAQLEQMTRAAEDALYPPAEWNKDRMAELWDLDGMDKVKDRLVELAHAGTLAPETLSRFDGLTERVEKLGLRLEEGKTQAEGFVDEIYAMAAAEDHLSSSGSKPGDDYVASAAEVAGRLSGQAEQWQALAAIREELAETGRVSAATISGMVQAFSELDGMNLNSFLETITDTEASSDELNAAMADLAIRILDVNGTFDDIDASTAALITDFLKSQGVINAEAVVLSRLNDSGTKVAAKFKELPGTMQKTIAVLSGMSDGWNSLGAAWLEFRENGALMADTLQTVVSQFQDLAGVDLDSFLNVATDPSASVDEVQAAFNRLATEYVYASGCLDGLTEANANYIIKGLEAQGVANAEAIVMDLLAVKKEYAAQTGRDLANATNDEIVAFLNECNATEEVKEKIAQYQLAKVAANQTVIQTSGDIQNIIALANAAGAAAKSIAAMKRAESIIAAAEKGSAGALRQLDEAQKVLDSIENGTFDYGFQLDASDFIKQAQFVGTASNGGVSTKSSSGSSGADEAKQEAEEQEQLFDWVQRRIEALDKEHDQIKKLTENETQSYRKRILNMENLMSVDQERVDFNKQASEAYKKEWDEAVSQISEEHRQQYKDLIMFGQQYREGVGLDPSDSLVGDEAEKVQAAREAWEKYTSQMDKETAVLEERNQHQREYLQLLEEEIQFRQEMASADIDRLDSERELAEASGLAVTEDLYREQIELSRQLASAYEDQIGNLQSQLDLTEEGSNEYYEIQSGIADCEAAIADCRKRQAEWNDAIRNLPIENIDRALEALENTRSDLDNFIAEREAAGGDVTESEYRQLSSLADRQLSELETKHRMLEQLLSEYDRGSDKYSDTLAELQKVEDTMSSLVQEQAEWNEAIARLPVERVERELDALDHARSDIDNFIAEQETAGRVVTENLYRQLNSLAEQQLSKLESQHRLLSGLLGRYDPDSQKYADTLAELQDVEDTMSRLAQEQSEWNEAIKRLPVERIQKYLDTLEDIRSDLQNYLDIQSGMGLQPTPDQLQEMIGLSTEEIQKLLEQQSKLKDLLGSYQYGSEKFSEIQDELQGIDDQITGLIQDQQEWNEQILEYPVQEIEQQLEALERAKSDLENYLAEQESFGSGITADQYQQLHDVAMQQLSMLETERQMLSQLLGIYDKNSSQYAETLARLQDIDDAISDIVQSQGEWNQAILDIPIQKIKQQIGILENVRSDIDNFISEQEAAGKATTLEQYQTLHAAAVRQLSVLETERQMLTQLLGVYDAGSQQYADILSQLQSVENSISGIVQEQYAWNEAILNIPIQKMEQEIGALEDIRSDLDNFMAEQEAAGKNATAEQYQQLHEVAQQQLALLETERQMLTQMLGIYSEGSSQYADTLSRLQDVDDSISGIVQEQEKWNEALLGLPAEKVGEANDKLDMYSSALQDALDGYDSVLAGVNALLEQQTDLLEESKEAAEEEYKAKIDPLQEELDLLEKENEARSVQLKLEQAEYDLDRAKNQKTNQVVRDGEMVYEADQDAIRSANEEMANALYEKQRYDLQTQIEALEEQRDSLLEEYDNEMERLNDISEKWSEIVDKIQQAADMQKANELFGAGWDKSILSGDDDALYQMFKQLYESTAAERDQTDRQIESNERVAEMMEKFVEDYRSGAITYEQALAGIAALIRDMQDGYTSLEQLAALMGLDGIGSLSDIAESTNQSMLEAVKELQRYLGIVESHADSMDQYTSSWPELQDSIQSQLDALPDFDSLLQMLRQYLDVVQSNAQGMAPYVSSWDELLQNVESQLNGLDVSSLLQMLQQYLGIIQGNEQDMDPYAGSSWGDVQSQLGALQQAPNPLKDFEAYLDLYKENSERFEQFTLTWDEMKQNIADQVAALEAAARALEQMADQQTYTGPSSSDYPSSDGYVSSGGYSSSDGHFSSDDHFDPPPSSSSSSSGGSGWGPGFVQPGESTQEAADRWNAMHPDNPVIPEERDGKLWWGLRHSGLETGMVGDASRVSERIRALGLRELKPNEYPTILQQGEVVANVPQQKQILRNFQRAASVGELASRMPDNTVSITLGNIILPNVKDPDGFAHALSTQFKPLLKQAVSKSLK